jgi:hypothetical protein
MAIRGTPRCNLKVKCGGYTYIFAIKTLADSPRGRPLIGKLNDQLKMHPWVHFPLPLFHHNNKQQENLHDADLVNTTVLKSLHAHMRANIGGLALRFHHHKIQFGGPKTSRSTSVMERETNGKRGDGKSKGFLRAVPAELEVLRHRGCCCEMTPCLLWWRRAPKSIPLLDLSLILASLYGEGGEDVGEHCQEGRHGGGEGIDEGS